MEKVSHYFKLLLYCYHLDEQDHYFVTDAANRALNWMFPAFIGPWMFVNVFLINNEKVSLGEKRMLKKIKYVAPLCSLGIMYLCFYFNNPMVEEIMNKYPYDMDLATRQRLDLKELKKR